MLSLPQTQHQERLSVPEQLKNIRSYLFKFATEVSQKFTETDAKLSQQQKEIAELKQQLAKYEGR